eukprot:820271-Prymnesium_polylepis.1
MSKNVLPLPRTRTPPLGVDAAFLLRFTTVQSAACSALRFLTADTLAPGTGPKRTEGTAHTRVQRLGRTKCSSCRRADTHQLDSLQKM